MKKILIIGFYELKDYFLNIKEHFDHFNYTVLSYPLFKFAYDSNDKISNYDIHLSDFIKSNEIDVVLWWFIDVNPSVFKLVKKNNPNTYFIMNNSDDPLNMSAELLEKAKIFNTIIVPCKENILKYKIHSGITDVLYIPHSFDPHFFYPLSNDESDDVDLKCDISFFCHNLFTDNTYYNNQYINKITLINDVITYGNENNKSVKIFGPPIFKSVYPNNYVCDLEYIKLNNLFNNSKINITTHPFQNKSCHINEYIMSILGSGGLLLVDKVKDLHHILTENECIYLDKTNYISQINDILNNYDNYLKIKENGHELSKKYSWEKYVEKIHISICKKHFDPEFYKKMYKIDIESDDELWKYWMNDGIKNNHVCYKFNIPSLFQLDEYASRYNLKNVIPEYVFYHWFINSKDQLFMKEKKNELNFKPDDNFIVMEDYFDICTIFNKITDGNDKDKGFDELIKFVKQRPFININNLLNSYLKMIE